jgi:hypothetical protein
MELWMQSAAAFFQCGAAGHACQVLSRDCLTLSLDIDIIMG